MRDFLRQPLVEFQDGLTDASNFRDHRTYIAFDTASASALVAEMKKHGVNMGLCGSRGVRLRPMLIFEEEHGELT